MQDYRKLAVWQRAHSLVLTVYAETASYPEDERFGLTGQTRRAAVSIPANIAEGCGRETSSELRRFLYVAMGSASELQYHLFLGSQLSFMRQEAYSRLESELIEIRRMLNTLIHKLAPDRSP